MSSSLARCRAYTLLGDLFRQGLTPASAAAWSAVPLARGALADLPLDQAAEVHTRVMLLDLPWRASAWLSADGTVGGPAVDDAIILTVRCGRAPGPEPDSLAAQLGTLAFLTGAVLDAETDGTRVPAVQDLERDALDALLAWLPGAVSALRQAGEPAPLYELAAELALDLALSHRATLRPLPTAPTLPPLPPLLDLPDTGLRTIAESLAVPALAGGAFARSTLVGLAREYEIPAGFGSRADLIEGLLRSAAHYGRLPDLFGALDAVAADWALSWRSLNGPLAPLAAPWQTRIAATRAVFARLADAHRPAEVD